ncbi:ABC transporter ATP-binding protein [Polynucleobacter sp. 73C-SIWE]|uniref:ABC transporter ATP-binding protein n=1 Tax=Polynucleobacter sp. 73C-SIWE TaxID=2689098 RepID=UPI001C0BFE3D|nr:ABC transporter ATP-binding protein [Polynucleobacter sp. 73C-SIWE]MBU3578646.1 ABC transporter ATP-binding protein [Polynucleobacter sp. 73C-SIWE]
MKNTFKKLYRLMTLHERRRVSILIILIVVMALFDVIGVASIMPFTMVVANPSLIETNPLLSQFYLSFDFSGSKPFIFFLGVITFAVLTISMAFKALMVYLQSHFILAMEHTLGQRLIHQYLHQPYIWFLNKNSAELGKTLLSEIGNVVSLVMTPAMNLIAQSFVAFALLALVFFVNPKLSLIVFLTLGLSYGAVHFLTGEYIKDIGKSRFTENSNRFLAVMEAFGAIKEVKISSLEMAYVERFSKPSGLYVKYQASFQVASTVPRFAIEAIAFGGMLLVMLYLLSGGGELAETLPIIALYGMAGYRLMPALQQIYNSITSLVYSKSAIDSLYSDVIGTALKVNQEHQKIDIQGIDKEIVLKNINFSYPGASKKALKNINIKIPVNGTIGLVGATGSGKTTIIDIILGLLEPNQGAIEVDGVAITKLNRASWHSIIGYVPQNIFLIDDTVAANIAFGIDPASIDMRRLENASKAADIHNFIHEHLPYGYETKVGERGICLSGGERQRIGIARALYRNPKLLVFDEATSALDNLTQSVVMNSVRTMGHQMTIIIVAHRLSTIRECDFIYHISHGGIISAGSYDELKLIDPIFNAMSN